MSAIIIGKFKNMIKKDRGEVTRNALSGISCAFVPINKKWAVKMYWDEETRDETYERQAGAAAHGVAPSVGACFDLPESDCPEDYRYGYITEIVECGSEVFNAIYGTEEYWAIWTEITDDLEAAINWKFEDFGFGNVGRKNGKWMCVDFGNFKMRTMDQQKERYAKR